MTRPTIRLAEDERLSDTVIDAVAAATDTDPLDLSPLYEVVDPDALDCLFRCDDRPAAGRLEFTIEGCDVCVHSSGRVVVRPSGSQPVPDPVVLD